MEWVLEFAERLRKDDGVEVTLDQWHLALGDQLPDFTERSIRENEAFIKTWNQPPQFTTMHRPGIARVSGDRVILDGTTIEEVEKYHRDTLKLSI